MLLSREGRFQTDGCRSRRCNKLNRTGGHEGQTNSTSTAMSCIDTSCMHCQAPKNAEAPFLMVPLPRFVLVGLLK